MKNDKQEARSGHSEEQKRQAVQESRAKGSTVKAVAAKYGVSANTLHTWRGQYPETGAISAPRNPRIRRVARTTLAIGGGNTEIIQSLRQDLSAARAEIKLLRDMVVDQELRHRGLGMVAQSHTAFTAGTERPLPNGGISATN